MENHEHVELFYAAVGGDLVAEGMLMRETYEFLKMQWHAGAGDKIDRHYIGGASRQDVPADTTLELFDPIECAKGRGYRQFAPESSQTYLSFVSNRAGWELSGSMRRERWWLRPHTQQEYSARAGYAEHEGDSEAVVPDFRERSGTSSPEGQAERSQARKAVRRAVLGLKSGIHRRVLIAALWLSLPDNAAAAYLGFKASTYRSHLRRARLAVSKLLPGWSEEHLAGSMSRNKRSRSAFLIEGIRVQSFLAQGGGNETVGIQQ